jgi:hypothetical protein
MKHIRLNLAAFAIVVFVYTVLLSTAMNWSYEYKKRNQQKPGIAEIQQIAQVNGLKASEVSLALRSHSPQTNHFVAALVTVTLSTGLTIGLFGIVRYLFFRAFMRSETSFQG